MSTPIIHNHRNAKLKNQSEKLQCKIKKFYHFALSFSILIFAFCIIPHSAHAGVIINRPLYIGLTNGLVGSWSFDGPDMAGVTAYDRSGQANNDTLTNGPVRAIGKIGQALNFDGSDDYINTNSKPLTGTAGNWTVTAWVKARVASSDMQVYSEVHTTNVPITFDFYLNKNAGGTLLRPRLKISNQSNSCASDIAGSTTMSPGAWYFVAARVDQAGNTMKTYLDGVEQVSGGACAAATSIDQNALIGERNITGGPDRFFDGVLDDVRIYNRALSPDEIKRLYNMGR